MYKDYNMSQITLPLNIEVLIPENDIAHYVNQIVESIPNKAFYEFKHARGASSYHPKLMLKIILYSYTQSIFYCSNCDLFNLCRKNAYQTTNKKL